ncbi:MAG: molybdenum ABC transporter ATP-binding protein [Candidatus Dactylopiibacterium sp.]|nr:molybdenum ABC transporter ATP-binding protein [Candidatus Dactylopiibacterium sp.]
MSPTALELRVRHRLPGFELDVDLTLPARGVSVLFGHSGSGKTTLLRCVAGLERAASARIAVHGEVWQDEHGGFVPAWQRPLGYVFQEASLFAHLDVRRNLAYGMRRALGRADAGEIEAMAERFGIAALLARRPDKLSGGERQRVAIARALLTRPRLLLMDEPLSALDAARKQEILPYLERLHDALEIPVLYVTHQIEEAARLADHLVLMEQGRVRAVGPLEEALARVDLPLAQDHEAGVVLRARVEAHEPDWHLTRLGFAGGTLHVSQRALEAGAPVRVRVLARDVSVMLEDSAASSIQNRFACTVAGISAATDPAHALVSLEASGTRLFARVTRRAVTQLGLAPGMAVWAQVKAVALLD